MRLNENGMDDLALRPVRRMRAFLRDVYFGHGPKRMPYRLSILILDFLVIGFFIAAPMLGRGPGYYILDYAIALVVAADLAARSWAYGDFRRWIRRPVVWADLAILITLLFPHLLANLGFLRVLRIWTLAQSGFVLRAIDDFIPNAKRYDEIIKALASFLAFVFVVTGFVYTFYARRTEDISSYVDALYFTVTTLTTTGFGDITLPGDGGRLLSIAIMLFGIGLFVRLAQAIFRPNKVYHECPSCGLCNHEPDAVHCKACGAVIHIKHDNI